MDVRFHEEFASDTPSVYLHISYWWVSLLSTQKNQCVLKKGRTLTSGVQSIVLGYHQTPIPFGRLDRSNQVLLDLRKPALRLNIMCAFSGACCCSFYMKEKTFFLYCFWRQDLL